jgi:hypothetical protein
MRVNIQTLALHHKFKTKTMKKTFLTLALVVLGLAVMAQGQPNAKIFSNFNYDLSAEDDAFKSFEIKRAYLGYSYKFDEKFSSKITFDVGNNNSGSVYTAFLKIASISWKATDKMTVNFGQIGTKNFKFMEKAWGHRYIYKSFQDQQKWASSADVGVSADYKIGSKLMLDAQVLNGEGFKKEQNENGLFRGTVGLTFKASSKLALRLIRDIVPREEYGDMNTYQNTSTAALAYYGANYTFGAEYNLREHAENITDQNSTGISTYLTYKLSKGVSIFGRYDEMSSEDDWNINKDGSFKIVGLEKQMTKGVKVAVNYQSYLGSEESSEEENTLFLNLEYKF